MQTENGDPVGDCTIISLCSVCAMRVGFILWVRGVTYSVRESEMWDILKWCQGACLPGQASHDVRMDGAEGLHAARIALYGIRRTRR